jgi:hypothetical protein
MGKLTFILSFLFLFIIGGCSIFKSKCDCPKFTKTNDQKHPGTRVETSGIIFINEENEPFEIQPVLLPADP